MPKIVNLPNIGEVKLVRRRGAKSLRISLSGNNDIRVTLPYYVPYSTGVDFVMKKQAWISDKLHPIKSLADNDLIGKYHRLRFVNNASVTNIKTRLYKDELRVTLPPSEDSLSPSVQQIVKKAAIKALKQQSDQLLPAHLASLASKLGYNYNSVTTKQLKARWGSCSNQKDIVLNVFLMNLPWKLIDYVLIHELVHTKVLSHGPDFWEEMSKSLPGSKDLKRELKTYSPYF
jgi:predicted metal-dependent hydrolase